MSADRTLSLERVFTAPATAVFDAWTSEDLLRLWWPAGPGWDTPVAEVEPTVGGRLRLVMRDPDGAEFGGEGRYLVLDRPHRLAFSWRWDGPDMGTRDQRVEVSFTDNGDGTTTVVLTNTGLTEAEERDHREGWLASFANLDTVLPGRSA